MRHLSLLGVLVILSCAPARFVVPLDKGEVEMHVSSGPISLAMEREAAGATLSLSSVCVGRGMTDNVTVFAALHPAMLFGLILSGQMGATIGVLRSPTTHLGASITPSFNVGFGGGSSGSIVPQLDGHIYWDHPNVRLYTGVNALLPVMGGSGVGITASVGIGVKTEGTIINLESKLPLSDWGQDLFSSPRLYMSVGGTDW